MVSESSFLFHAFGLRNLTSSILIQQLRIESPFVPFPCSWEIEMTTVSANNGDSAPTHLLLEATVHSTDHVSTVARKRAVTEKLQNVVTLMHCTLLVHICNYLSYIIDELRRKERQSEGSNWFVKGSIQRARYVEWNELHVSIVHQVHFKDRPLLQHSQICKLARICHRHLDII